MIASALSAADSGPTSVSIQLSKAYIPIGFDDNDRVQVVVEGTLPNSCYKVDPLISVVDTKNRTITLEQKALLYPGVCIETLVPFTKVAEIGLLSEGSYRLQDKMGKEDLGTLPVTRATKSEADDYLYAPITDAYVTVSTRDANTKKFKLHLTGAFTDRCTKLKNVVIHYYSDVIVVQPIAVRAGTRGCTGVKSRFSWDEELNSDLKGSKLLHVRSMNGEAINKVVDFDE